MKRVLVTVVLVMGILVVCGQAQATLVLYTPTTIQASSTTDDGAPGSTYGVLELIDGTALTAADIGTTNNLSSGTGSGQWASYGWRPGAVYGSPAVIMDFGSSTTFDSIVYSQRSGGADNVASISLWFSNSPYALLTGAPGAVDGPEFTPNPAGAADESFTITEATHTLRKYDFTSDHTARYAFARFYVPEGWTIGSSNPGGSEFRLGNEPIPEPSTLVLLTCGLLGLLAYAWRRRR